ncbi:MAG TPA: N-acetylmuramoyl-L-alanine amidase family protein [Candidatus Caccovicinus merdipullorum]|uniref:N-acetylmuramoyl-L-alanine amidase family protein n=1 Tax=Candidatus Caccovicinus merdipullorum TaxID=2840724 RepID=A0A9D1GHK7_9FIRM|nr:N-acetylmuramoyl-L-alanine amidase family protein [Candidatus Caccovicinus merdipullorum]
MKKQILCLLLAAGLAWGSLITAEAAETRIEQVAVEITCSPVPAAGDEPGSVTASTTGTEFTIESAEYTNDTDVWVLGDEPVVMVELYAKDGYRFSYTTKSHFTITGEGAAFKRARLYDSGSRMELQIELDQITGRLPGPEYLEWDGNEAVWEELDGAKGYEVRLYRNGRTVVTEETTREFFDFENYFTREGDYSFRVRGIARYNNRAGEWSDYSDDNYIDEWTVSRTSGNGRWIQDPRGWWYMYESGGYPASCWKEIKNAWYYFNSDGYILTHWGKIDGRWYYFGADGARKTGWQFVDGRWYYLEDNGIMATQWKWINGKWYYLDASGAMTTGWQYIRNRWYYMDASGAMTTGWQYINGKWYCMDSNGVMYANTWTPDGRYVDASGALVR